MKSIVTLSIPADVLTEICGILGKQSPRLAQKLYIAATEGDYKDAEDPILVEERTEAAKCGDDYGSESDLGNEEY
jgi:hypothetical protein